MQSTLQRTRRLFAALLIIGLLPLIAAHAQWETYNNGSIRGRFIVHGDEAVASSSGNAVYVTDDDGVTWTEASPPWSGSAGPAVKHLYFGGRFYMYGSTGTDSFVRTTDSVHNWEIVPGLEKPNRNGSFGLSWMATDGEVLWIRTFNSTDYPNGQIFTSTDGETWTHIADAVGYGKHTFFDGKLYAMSGRTIVTSTDYGASWETLGDIGPYDLMRFMPAHGRLYALVEDDDRKRFFQVSDDGGETWSVIYEQGDGVGINPIVAGEGLVMFQALEMSISTDGGQTWSLADPQPAWVDHPFSDGEYLYVAKTTFGRWIQRIPLSTYSITPTSTGPADELPARVTLESNYPNPFNPSTSISFTLDRADHVDLRVHDLLGSEVAVLVSGMHPAGRATVEFDATGLASGVYLYRLTTPQSVQTRRMVLQK